MMKALIESGADINAIDGNGNTVLDLFFAGKNMSYDVLLLLKDHGFKFDRTTTHSKKRSYFQTLSSKSLRVIDGYSVVFKDWPRLWGGDDPSTEEIENISGLKGNSMQYHYYYSLQFLREFH